MILDQKNFRLNIQILMIIAFSFAMSQSCYANSHSEMNDILNLQNLELTDEPTINRKQFEVIFSSAIHQLMNEKRDMSNSTLPTMEKINDQESSSNLKHRTFWSYPSGLGALYISQYLLSMHWLGIPIVKTPLNEFHYKKWLIHNQLKNGGWELLQDTTFKVGNLNATIFHYWALKAMGVPINYPNMLKAKEFILKNGGIEASALFTRLFLIFFGLSALL